MMEGKEWEVILALAGVVQVLAGGIIRYLLGRIAKLETTVERMTEAQNTANQVNAAIVARMPGLLEEREADHRRPRP